MTGLIKKATELMNDQALLNVISSAQNSTNNSGESTQANMMFVGIQIIKVLLDVLEDETHEWFAELVGVKKEEFLDMPIDTEPKIINHIAKSDEVSNFFTLASQLHSQIQKYQALFARSKTK